MSCRGGNPPQSLVEAVRDNLYVILNTQQGSVLHLPGFGLPDFSRVYAHEPQCLEYLRQQLLVAIKSYEPRLIDIRVGRLENSEAESDLAMCFRVDACLRLAEGERIVYQTTVRDSQEIEVERVSGARD